ncbi:MAG: class I SAM-dependent methyltransferase [Dehalococcoidia bacterium]|nr:class I SAM-dependent methyltransferase [Dehalococcoidia bacterium]
MIGSDFWARYFRDYDKLNLVPSYVELLTSICEELRPEPNSLVLDIGSGTGNLALQLQARGCRVVALDFCRDAMHCHRAKHDDARLVLADLTKGLPFKEDCFDAIASNNVLYALSAADQVAAVRELHRVLRPGGRIVLANPWAGWKPLTLYRRSVRSSARALGWGVTVFRMVRWMVPQVRMFYYNRKLAKESHYHYFEPDEQRRLLETCGFRPLSDTKWVYEGQALLDCAAK